MFNKESCRKCGWLLIPNILCNECNEIVLWICKNCMNEEEYIHSHNQGKTSKIIRMTTTEIRQISESDLNHYILFH